MKTFLAKTLAAALVAASVAPVSWADDATALLQSELAKTPAAGKFLQSFAGPAGLTGAVIEMPNQQKMVVYLTPDGRYMISGVVVDLMTNDNLTAVYARKYAGLPQPVAPVTASASVLQASKMTGAVFGNEHAPNYIQVVFDPSTEQGRKLLFTTMNQAAHLVGTYMYTQLHIDFFPYGPKAAALLTGDNKQRLHNLLLFSQNKPLPAPTKEAQSQALQNAALSKTLGINPPAMVAYLPGMKMAKAISFEHATGPQLDPQVQALINLTGGGAAQ